MDYKKAGVDIEAGYRSVELIREHVKGTLRPEVLGGLGGFSGAFSLAQIKKMEHPVLLSGTDGVGTKLKLAFLLDRHDTVGIDCVAMCVNDVACAGGEPLFFLDYIACGKNEPEKIASIVQGVAEGCKQAGAALNGFSLVRKVFEMTAESLNAYYEELHTTLGEALLTPTRIYVKALRALKDAGIAVQGCSHITGGGFYENIPRMLPEGKKAVIRRDSYPVPPIFRLLQEKGKIADSVMYNTYNMGLGMVLAVRADQANQAVRTLKEAGEQAWIVGAVEPGEREAVVC